MALAERGIGEAKAEVKAKSPREALAEALERDGYSIMRLSPGLLGEIRPQLSMQGISHIKMLYNHQYKMALPELLGFDGPAILVFKRHKVKEASLGIESLFDSLNTGSDNVKKRKLTQWMHSNLLFTRADYIALERMYGKRDHYTKEDYRQAQPLAIRLRDQISSQRVSLPLRTLRIDQVARWGWLRRVKLEEEVRSKGFVMMGTNGHITDESKQALDSMGLGAVRVAVNRNKGYTASRMLGFTRPTTIFFDPNRRELVCNELMHMFKSSSETRTERDWDVFYHWLANTGLSSGVLTSTGRPAGQRNSVAAHLRGNSIKP